jgi:hypothetical protein
MMDLNDLNSDDTAADKPVARTVWVSVLCILSLAGFALTGYLVSSGKMQDVATASGSSDCGISWTSNAFDSVGQPNHIAATEKITFESMAPEDGQKKSMSEIWADFLALFQPQPSFSLRLDGVKTAPPSAMINRQVLREGDVILGAKLVQLSTSRVTLRYEGREFEIKLGEARKIVKQDDNFWRQLFSK